MESIRSGRLCPKTTDEKMSAATNLLIANWIILRGMWKAVLCAALTLTLTFAQAQVDVIARDANAGSIHGTTPRRNASEYPAHVRAYGGKAVVAAEFMGRTISGE